jgi:quinol monooxygenase YgiN
MAEGTPPQDPTTTIRAGAPGVAFVNVFTVTPEQQHELVRLLTAFVEEVVRGMPGFISANLHRSVDGKRVVNYAQWESAEALRAMLAHPDSRSHLQRISAIGDSDPTVCEVVSVHPA